MNADLVGSSITNNHSWSKLDEQTKTINTDKDQSYQDQYSSHKVLKTGKHIAMQLIEGSGQAEPVK